MGLILILAACGGVTLYFILAKRHIRTDMAGFLLYSGLRVRRFIPYEAVSDIRLTRHRVKNRIYLEAEALVGGENIVIGDGDDFNSLKTMLSTRCALVAQSFEVYHKLVGRDDHPAMGGLGPVEAYTCDWARPPAS